MTVTVFGLGFVGLTTALGLAHIGHRVHGIEVDAARKKLLLDGDLPFYEPYMGDELKALTRSGAFSVTDSVEQAVAESESIFYCVGTPYGPDGAADLTMLFRAIDQTLEIIQDSNFRVLVTKSTVPPSTTTHRIQPYIRANAPRYANICVANNPEFLREGSCWMDFMEADRIVIGCDEGRGQELVQALYAPMNIPIFCVSPSTSEFIKYLSNTLLATLISYSNEMAQAAEAIGGIQVPDAFRILHMDKRWKSGSMASYAYPGCGYGGYCLPKDTCAFRAQARLFGVEPAILDMVIRTNEQRPHVVALQIAAKLSKDQPVGIAGLAFKPGSDDVRESSARQIICELNEMGYHKILAYDPVASGAFQRSNPELRIEYCRSLDELCRRSDRIAITTAWSEFSELADRKDKDIVDCRYMLGGLGAAGKSFGPG